MKNYAHLGGCYPPRPSAWMDNILLDLHNSSYPGQPHSIIAKYTCSIILSSIGKKSTVVPISVALETGSRSRSSLEILPIFFFSEKRDLITKTYMVLDAGQGNIFIKAKFSYLFHLFDCFFSLCLIFRRPDFKPVCQI